MKKVILILFMIVMLALIVSCSKKKEDEEEKEEGSEKSQSITLTIDEIKDDYFLAESTLPSANTYKVYVDLEDEYCVGDHVIVYYDEMEETEEDYYEITALSIKDAKLEEMVVYKPIIYLYPTEKTNISVNLDFNGILTHTYPTYASGWSVTAYPDGTLVDKNGQEYPYLFWEGYGDFEYDMTKGFCIPGDETEEFLIDKLSFMGLNQNELKEFIEFWIPFMDENPYNKISFQTTNYTENAKLIVNPKANSILRIFMVFQPLDEFVEIEEQKLNDFERTGFTLVEWGGSIIK